MRFCRTPIGPPNPGEDTAAEVILLSTGENFDELDDKFGFPLADVRLFDVSNSVLLVPITFGDRCDALF